MSLAQNMYAAVSANSPMPTLSFGQHKGKPIDQIETEYLKWCLRSADAVKKKPYLVSKIEEVLETRRAGAAVQPPLPVDTEPLNNTADEQRLLEEIDRLRAELHRERLDMAAMQREIRNLEHKRRKDNVSQLREENRDLQDEVAAMRRARAAGAGSDAKAWWAANKRRIANLCHPDKGGSNELMQLMNALNEKLK